MFNAWKPNVDGVWAPNIHAVCSCNERAALLLRSLGPTPSATKAGRASMGAAFGWLRSVVKSLGCVSRSHLDIARSYEGKLRARYLRAEESLRLDGGVVKSDTRLKAFLKAEKFNGMSKFAKPRMIFPRSYRYNLDLATRLKPLEHALWPKLRAKGSWGVPRTRVVAKGLGPDARASLIREKLNGFGGEGICFEVDASAFEAHQESWQLVEEHRIYQSAYPGDAGLQSLLTAQLRNRGITPLGYKFSREGGRASGDLNTGMGNSLLMLAIVETVLAGYQLTKRDCLVDGDNALVFLLASEAQPVVETFAQRALVCSGHEMVLERPVSVLEHVRFGQSAPVCINGRWRMVRDWRKVLSHGCSNHAHLREPNFVRPFLRGVALCELSLARGLPIIQRWCEAVLGDTAGSRVPDPSFYRDYLEMGASLSGPLHGERVEASTRESFARAFGLSVMDQLIVEDSLVCQLGTRFGEPRFAPTCRSWFMADPGLIETWVDRT